MYVYIHVYIHIDKEGGREEPDASSLWNQLANSAALFVVHCYVCHTDVGAAMSQLVNSLVLHF